MVFDLDSKREARDQLTKEMERPDFWDNQEKAQQIIQQLKPLNGLLKPLEDLEASQGDLEAMAELSEEDDSFEAELARELSSFEKRLDEFELRTIMSGSQDASNAFLRVQAGAGGTEACDWADMLKRMYLRWAERNNYQVEIVDELVNEEAGIRSGTIRVIGEYAFGHLQSESGVHRLVRKSPFDTADRRHTAFAAVDVMPEIDGTIEIEIRPEDIERKTCRAGGPGGQHQNKTESAVRLTHLPTGVYAECRNERSQHKNAAMALQMLKAKLYRIEEQKQIAAAEALYDEKGEVAWGFQIRNYVMEPYTKVTDRRTGVETPQIQKVLDGEIDDLIQAYLRYKAERELRN